MKKRDFLLSFFGIITSLQIRQFFSNLSVESSFGFRLNKQWQTFLTNNKKTKEKLNKIEMIMVIADSPKKMSRVRTLRQSKWDYSGVFPPILFHNLFFQGNFLE